MVSMASWRYFSSSLMMEATSSAGRFQFSVLEKKSEITEDDRKEDEKELQELTDKRCKEIDALTAAKEKELMAI